MTAVADATSGPGEAPKTCKSRAYTDDPHQILPDPVVAQLRIFQAVSAGANHLLTAAMIKVRDADWGIPCIAAALDMNPRAVARRVARGRRHPGVNFDLSRFEVPPPPVPADQHPNRGELPPLPEELAAPLRELYPLAVQCRGGMGANDPRTVAAHQLAARISALRKMGYRDSQINRALGVSPGMVGNRMSRWGGRIPPAPATAPSETGSARTPRPSPKGAG